MITFEELTENQLKILRAYSYGGIGWFSAVSRLMTLNVDKKSAEDIVNKTGIMDWMI